MSSDREKRSYIKCIVGEFLANAIFVTTTILEALIENDDKMVVKKIILHTVGREESDLTHGHTSKRKTLNSGFRTIDILIVYLDATEGLLSVSIMAALAVAMFTTYLKHNATDAEELSIIIVASACFDYQDHPSCFTQDAYVYDEG